MHNRQLVSALVLLACGVAASPAQASVETGPSGFLVRHEVAIAATPAVVYDTLVSRVGAWWNLQRTYSQDSASLSIMAGGVERMAPAVDGMLAEQLQRLRLLPETGGPAPR
ncbi:hypothetical protein ACFPOE_14060 [Caenimonas terrae]|uniref:FAD:protein FMN transferase n=1 Tax=Caenimonas terrae TaxID=696074 RepID=A0ABW0NHA2_9BURK